MRAVQFAKGPWPFPSFSVKYFRRRCYVPDTELNTESESDFGQVFDPVPACVSSAFTSDLGGGQNVGLGEEVLVLPVGDRGPPWAHHEVESPASEATPRAPSPAHLAHPQGAENPNAVLVESGRMVGPGGGPGGPPPLPSFPFTHCPQCPSELRPKSWPQTWTVSSEASSLHRAGSSRFRAKQEVASPVPALPSL